MTATAHAPSVDLGNALTIYQVAQRRAEILQAMQDSPAVTLDLRGVTELDGAGLQLLVHLQLEAQRRQCGLHFSEPGPAVQEAFALCRMNATQDTPDQTPASGVEE